MLLEMPLVATVGARSVSNSSHLDSEYHRSTEVSPRVSLYRDGRFRHLHEPADGGAFDRNQNGYG